MEISLSNIKFNKITRQGSNVGFVSFVLNGCILFKNVAIHQRADKDGYRLVYEDKEGRASTFPINREAQQGIDTELFGYLKAQELLT